ncbi:MAG: FG-GAP-like repeat-containing protein [Candidatus Zixiibacteriota bacterium]|jgi:hypothetical protein
MFRINSARMNVRFFVSFAALLLFAGSASALIDKAPFPILVDMDQGRPVESSPSMGDINGDGRDEIVIGCKDGKVYAFDGRGQLLPGWPVSTGDTVAGSPAIGDINGDKRGEVIIGSDDGNVYALTGSGNSVPGFPVSTGGPVRSTAAVADLDGDMRDDIIIGSSDGKVYAISGSGNSLIGWPVRVGGGVESSPAVADVDGDDLPEVAVGADDGNVYLIDNDGKIVPGWPVETRYYVRSSPAIGDIDNDGSLEIVVGSDDFNVYAWNANGTLVAGWPVATEYKLSIASPALADLDGDKKLDVIIGSGDQMLYAWDGTGSPLSGWPVQTFGRLYNSSPCVADVNGDNRLDIVVGGEDINLYIFDDAGRQIEDSPVPLFGPCRSSPAVGDIDGDGLLELCVADNASNLYCYDLRGSAALGRGARWSEFHQSHWKAGVYGYVGGASQLPKCVVPKMEGEYAGDLSIEYSLSDPQLDTLDLKVLYSDDWGHTWHEATVTGMTSDLGPHRYQGVIVWDSRADLKGPLEKGGERDADVLSDEWREYREQKDVKIKIIPVDPNGFGTAGETTLLHVDNNVPPVVVLKPITEEVSKDIYFDYEITDPEHDLVAIKAEYSLDGGATWTEATVDGAVADIRSSRYKGSVTWESDKNVEGLDQENVMFRLTPADNDPGEIGTISDLHVDNNAIPQVSVNDIEEEVGGDVEISYTLSDPESDPLSMKLHYSVDGGQTWKEATVTGTTEQITSAMYGGTITWNSRTDTLGVDKTSVQFRVTPLDNDEGKTDATGSFHLDNNDTPTLVISPVAGEQSGPVEVIFDISDPEGDPVTLLPEYYDEDDGKWKIATVTGGLTDLEPAGYAGSFVWDSYVDMLGIDNESVKYRITAFDNDQGEPVEAQPFHVDDNSAPAVLVNDITTEQEQDVVIAFTLSDLERDTLSFRAEFSEDGGATWQPASVSGTTEGIGVEDYVGEITWHSDRDTMNKHLSAARFRLVPSDNDEGRPGSTSDFTVDNNNPPSVEIAPITTEQAGPVAIRYTLRDDEGDSLSILGEYSNDGGRTWTPATVSGTTEGITGGGYSGVINWDSAADVPGIDQEDILFRITPSDLDVGEPVASAAIHIDNSTAPSVTVATPGGEQYGDIPIEYTIADDENDVVNVRAEYSEDGGMSWYPATVEGQLTDIYSSGYLGSVVWLSQEDLGGTDQTDIAFRVVPSDNDEGAPGRTENFHLDNNEIPTISVETPEGEQSGNVEISYQLDDPESDASLIKTEYSIDDGFTWHEATVATTTRMDPTRYTGVVVWDSKADLPDIDREDVRFRVTPFDNDEGLSDVTGSFHLDNNTAPTVTVPPVNTESTGDVEVGFGISDVDASDVSLKVEYSTDGGSSWTEATVGGSVEGLTAGDYDGSLQWNSFADLPGVDSENVLLRITPSDNDAGEGSVVENIHVDNNDPPRVVLTDIYEEQEGDVTIEYNITDAENDAVDLAFEYSIDGGSTWKAPTLVSPATGVSPSGYAGSVVWHSAQDIKGVDSSQVLIRAKPSDNDEGTAFDTAEFQVDNNDPPTLEVLPPEEVGRDQVNLGYRVSDAEGDTVGLYCEYSIDDGVTWDEATVSGALEGISSASYAGSLSWNAREDIGGVDSSRILFRVTPTDADEGGPVVSRPFRVDVNDPPYVEIRALAEEQGDEIPIDYELFDEEGDQLSVKCEYSTDGGTTWKPASVTGDTSDISPITYANTVVWQARQDLGAVDTSSVAFRITPSDVDVGQPGQITNITVDTNRPPTVEASVAAADTTGDVQVNYVVTDEENDAVSLVVEYSEDGGFTFEPATTQPGVTGLGAAQYRGSFTWLATADAGGEDLSDAVVRVTPRDNDEGEPSFSTPFRVDNNHAPTVTVSQPAGEKVGGEVDIDYRLSDDEGDRLSIVAEYSTDGVSWKPATVFGLASDIGPDRYDGSIVWSLFSDVPGEELRNVAFRLTPYDSQVGTPGTIGGLFVDTNEPPQVVVSDVIAEQENDAVELDYSIIDNEGDPVSLTCEYSTDGGTTWKPATMLGSTTNLSESSYFGVVKWDAARDLGRGVETDVVFRMTAKDADAGEPAENRPFRVDLNAAPSASLTSYEEKEDGSVEVSYTVRDDENDAVTLNVFYSEDGGASWFMATVEGNVAGVPATGSQGTFTWERLRDVPTILPGSSIKLRVVPMDEDEGQPSDLSLDLKTTGGEE